MTPLRGTLKLGDQLLLENVPVSVKQSINKSGINSWNGSFIAPVGMNFDADGPYTLSLEDGRSGMILISSMTINSGATLVEFQSTGHFG